MQLDLLSFREYSLEHSICSWIYCHSESIHWTIPNAVGFIVTQSQRLFTGPFHLQLDLLSLRVFTGPFDLQLDLLSLREYSLDCSICSWIYCHSETIHWTVPSAVGFIVTQRVFSGPFHLQLDGLPLSHPATVGVNTELLLMAKICSDVPELFLH